MRFFFALTILAAGLMGFPGGNGAEPSPPWVLTGILASGKEKKAMIELRDGDRRSLDAKVLGEREEVVAGPGLSIEALEIDEKTGKARLSFNGESRELVLSPSDGEQVTNAAVWLKSASARRSLQLYQVLSGRTVIYGQGLTDDPIDLVIEKDASPKEATERFMVALGKQEILVKDYGDKFCVALPSSKTNVLSLINPLPAGQKSGWQEQIIPARAIKFTDANIYHVLEIYGELAERTILRPVALVNGNLTLTTQIPCSRAECIWALGTALNLAGLETLNIGSRFVAVGMPEQLKLMPPLDPAIDKEEAEIVAGAVKFVNIDANMVLPVYAELVGRTPAMVPGERNNFKVTYKTQTPLTKAQVLYGLEATAALNGFRFEPVGEKQVKISPLKPQWPPFL